MSDHDKGKIHSVKAGDPVGGLEAGKGFIPCETPKRYCSAGQCWEIAPDIGNGFYWIYACQDLFYVKVHDFCFHEDTLLAFDWPETMSITRYDSISGEELAPYRRLRAGCVKTFIGGKEQYRVLVHGKVPVRAVGIEITPAYCREYLQRQYPDSYKELLPLFLHIDQTVDFPEMERLLHQVAAWRGEGMAAALFYESKVMEAICLVAEFYNKHAGMRPYSCTVSGRDREQLENLAAYLNDHFAGELSQPLLARIACMGTTKLKKSFHAMYGCTITEYVQQRRIAQAERLLQSTDLSIGQIAGSVGYVSASRFSELFRRNTGMLPSEYRKLART